MLVHSYRIMIESLKHVAIPESQLRREMMSRSHPLLHLHHLELRLLVLALSWIGLGSSFSYVLVCLDPLSSSLSFPKCLLLPHLMILLHARILIFQGLHRLLNPNLQENATFQLEATFQYDFARL